MAKLSAEELSQGLGNFVGTTQWYKHPLYSKFVYTDGVRYLAINAEAYWLLEYVLSNQIDKAIQREEFQTWKLLKDDSKATITVDDGNGKILKEFNISYTDFPLEKITLWMVGNCVLLPSEY